MLQVLDGGYSSWVYHFPKHCTNPDRAKKAKAAPPKTRRSAPESLRPLNTAVKAPAIYPLLTADAEPKPIPLSLPPQQTPLPAAIPTPTADVTNFAGPAVSVSGTSGTKSLQRRHSEVPAANSGGSNNSSPSIVTCGNVQISMPQSPQTIQINQWNQEKQQAHPSNGLLTSGLNSQQQFNLSQIPTQDVVPNLQTRSELPLPNHNSQPGTTHYNPIPTETRSLDMSNKRNGSSLKITDVYEGAPKSVPQSQLGAIIPQPTLREHAASYDSSSSSTAASQSAKVVYITSLLCILLLYTSHYLDSQS